MYDELLEVNDQPVATTFSYAMTKYLVITLILAGGACLTAFHFSGAYVDAEGMLHEPFALLATGYLLLIAGTVSWLVARRNKQNGNPEPPL